MTGTRFPATRSRTLSGEPILLDMNQLLHLAYRPDLLTREARAALAEAEAYYVLVATAWEIEIKRRLTYGDGRPKLEVEGSTASLVRYAIEKGGTLLPLTLDHVAAELDVPCPNRDPFDRVLLQQGQVEGGIAVDERYTAARTSIGLVRRVG